MTRDDDNPWSPDYVPPLRPEDVPPQGWGNEHGGWSAYGAPPRKSRRLPGSLAGAATLSAIGAWGGVLALAVIAGIVRGMDSLSAGEQFLTGWLAGIGMVFIGTIGFASVAVGFVAGVVAIPLLAVFVGEKQRSMGVTLTVAHAVVAWIVLVVTTWQVL